MHSNSTIITINKSKYIKLFKDFLLSKSVDIQPSHLESFHEWLRQSTQRYLTNALLPSGHQYRLLSNVGADKYNEILLHPDHEDITTVFFSNLVKYQVRVTGEYYTQVMVFLEWLSEDLNCYLKGKSPQINFQLLYCSEYQITYQQEVVETPILGESVKTLPPEALQNSELFQHCLSQFDIEQLANQVEIINESLKPY